MKHSQNNILWDIWDIFYVFIICFIVFVFITGIFLYFSLDKNSILFNFLTQICVSASLIISVFCIIKIKYRLSLREIFGINIKKYKYYLRYTAFAFFGILLATAFISYFFTKFSHAQNPNPYADLPHEKVEYLMYISVFLSPFVEEIFFRGFLQPVLVKKTGMVTGVISTAFIFTVAHVQYLSYDYAFMTILAIGIILGFAKERTASILPGMAAHLLNNLLACTVLF